MEKLTVEGGRPVDSEKIPLLCVVGPTASGKTWLAVELAKAFDGEVVSADSMQVYKTLSIGTAKPSPEEMQSELRKVKSGTFQPPS